MRFFYVSVSRDEIFTALAEGKGDIAAANLSITSSRETLVDFAKPHLNSVREVVLTGPASPALSTLDDLAGKEVFVRKSSSAPRARPPRPTGTRASPPKTSR